MPFIIGRCQHASKEAIKASISKRMGIERSSRMSGVAKAIAASKLRGNATAENVKQALKLVLPHRLRSVPFKEPKPVTEKAEDILQKRKAAARWNNLGTDTDQVYKIRAREMVSAEVSNDLVGLRPFFNGRYEQTDSAGFSWGQRTTRCECC